MLFMNACAALHVFSDMCSPRLGALVPREPQWLQTSTHLSRHLQSSARSGITAAFTQCAIIALRCAWGCSSHFQDCSTASPRSATTTDHPHVAQVHSPCDLHSTQHERRDVETRPPQNLDSCWGTFSAQHQPAMLRYDFHSKDQKGLTRESRLLRSGVPDSG
eukprot:1001942-Amphidinium_carterae.1